jgi:hypothetical protein
LTNAMASTYDLGLGHGPTIFWQSRILFLPPTTNFLKVTRSL